MAELHNHPKLRPVEVHPSPSQPGGYDLSDPSGLMSGVMTVSGAVMSIFTMMDGHHRREMIQAEFMRRHGSMLFSDDLAALIAQLDDALLLEGPTLDAHMAELTQAYRDASVRFVRDKQSLGAPWDRLGPYFDSILDDGDGTLASGEGRVVGLVAPHLDYERGAPCYASAYRSLLERTDARRFVILGTNHFGRPVPVVMTQKDFETPFGTVPHDADFIRRLEARCGANLCDMEYDHIREHSIELQVHLLKHALGDRAFSIVPCLCTEVGDAMDHEKGAVSLRDFAFALREEIISDNVPTCIIAGADLSHVGRYFQGNRDLDADYLHTVEASDRLALEQLLRSDADGFRSCVAKTENATSICSVGSLYILSAALKDRATPHLLKYHQAVKQDAENCVTCAAMEFTTPDASAAPYSRPRSEPRP